MTLVTLSYRPSDGDPEDIAQIIADFDDILAVLNGDIRADNISPSAAIPYASLSLTNQIKNADIAAAAAIAGTKMAAATIADDRLLSPNSGVYRTVSEVVGSLGASGAVGTGTYFFKSDQAGVVGVATGDLSVPAILAFDPADYAVAGKTLKLNLSTGLCTNATAAGTTFKVGLYPIASSAGGAQLINLDVGTVVSGSEVTFTTPASNSRLTGTSGDFTAPAAGVYAICVAVSGGGGGTAANHYSLWSTRLRMRSV